MDSRDECAQSGEKRGAVMAQHGKLLPTVASDPLGCWFETCLLHFRSSSIMIHLRKQPKVA